MLKKIKNIRKKFGTDELLKGSIILFVMIGLFNIFNYLFQISMARMLGPADYSILAVLMSFLYIFGIPTEAIQTIITKYASKFNPRRKKGQLKDLLYRSLRKAWIVSIILYILFIPFAIIFSKLLDINFFLILLTGLFIFYAITLPVIRCILQGMKRFSSMGWNLVLESSIKFLVGLALVYFGLKVWGAIGSFIIGSTFAFALVFIVIKDIIKSKRKGEIYDNIISYNLPILVAITAIVLIYSLDVILVRRYFSPEIAGQYAFVSLIGKTILFSSFAIGKAMFPLSSQNFEKKKNTLSIFKKSLIITFLVAIIALILFFIAPNTIVKLLSLGDTRYLGAANILFLSGLSFSFASFSYIMILYNVSINKMKKSSWGLLVFVALQFILLKLFNQTLMTFTFALMVVNLLMLIYNIWITKK